MNCVIISAKETDKKFWDTIQKVISNSFSTISIYKRKLSAQCNQAEIILTDAKSFDLIQAQSALIIFKDVADFPASFLDQTKAVAVVDSAVKENLSFVSETNLPAITCGLRSYDTITLSSFGTENVVVNLQRCVTNFKGESIEPQEIPLKLDSTVDSFTIMAITSIFLFYGSIKQLCDLEI